jgi:hypothetical protein
MTQLFGLPARNAGHPLIVLQGIESGVLASVSDWLALAAAVSGVVGAGILFVSNYALPPPPFPAPPLPGDPQERQKVMDAAAARGRKMLRRQRTGLAFLCLSFVLQTALVLLV